MANGRASKFAYAELHGRKTATIAEEFLRRLTARLPFRIHTILTDNGLQFTGRGKGSKASAHVFDCVCREKGIGHRLTKANHPWTNGQVERMNRTIRGATVKKCHCGSRPELEKHFNTFPDACNFARRLKALKGKTPFGEIVKWWGNKPGIFTRKPTYDCMGLSTYTATSAVGTGYPVWRQPCAVAQTTINNGPFMTDPIAMSQYFHQLRLVGAAVNIGRKEPVARVGGWVTQERPREGQSRKAFLSIARGMVVFSPLERLWQPLKKNPCRC